MRVFIIGRDARRLAATQRALGRHCAGLARTDLSVPGELRGLATQLVRSLRRIDVLVHCAGEHGFTQAGNSAAQPFDRLFAINVRAPYLLTQALVRPLARAAGQVIFLNSSVVRHPGTGVALYKATQHAVQGFTDSLRQDLNRHEVRVTSLYPGRTATPRMRRIYAHEGRRYRPQVLLRPGDLAQLVALLTDLPARMELTDLHVRSIFPY